MINLNQEFKGVNSIRNATREDKKEYWESWIANVEEKLNTEDPDKLDSSLFEVMKVAIENEQYLPSDNEFEDVKRVIKFRINLPRKAIDRSFGITTYGVYGVGLFTLVEGILLDEVTRKETNYDCFEKKGKYFDLSMIPEEVVKTHEFRLAVPAMGGLFVPKKTSLTNCIAYRSRLQYFDIML